MSVVKQCDFCKKAITNEPGCLKITVGTELDICDDCFCGSVNLSERRWMRKGKAKPKVGRSRKVRVQVGAGPQVDLLPDSTGVYASPDPDAPKEPFEVSDQTKSVIRRRAIQRGIKPPEQPAA